MSEVGYMKMPCNLLISVSPARSACRTSPTTHQRGDPGLTPGAGCELGVPVRPVLLNALWQVVCETPVFCLFPLPSPVLADSVSIVSVKGPGFVSPASLEPALVQKRARAHTSTRPLSSSVDLPAQYLPFSVHLSRSLGGFVEFKTLESGLMVLI